MVVVIGCTTYIAMLSASILQFRRSPSTPCPSLHGLPASASKLGLFLDTEAILATHHSLNGSSDSVNGNLQFLWG